MFELEGTTYTLRFNKQKIKTVELTTGISIVSAITANKGILSYQTVETLFVSGLVEEQGLVAVKQKEALDIFDKLVEEKGLISLNVAVIEKLQEDMGFFVPIKQVDFEYFGADEEVTEESPDYNFDSEKQLAFFVVNFHMSKSEFDQLTELEKLFVMKEWENKVIFDSTMLRNAVLNADQNMNRKRNSRFIELHKKRQQKADVNYNANALQAISENEQLEGKRWIEQIYQANGIRKPRK